MFIQQFAVLKNIIYYNSHLVMTENLNIRVQDPAASGPSRSEGFQQLQNKAARHFAYMRRHSGYLNLVIAQDDYSPVSLP